jgi:hypothetical protein
MSEKSKWAALRAPFKRLKRLRHFYIVVSTGLLAHELAISTNLIPRSATVGAGYQPIFR